MASQSRSRNASGILTSPASSAIPASTLTPELFARLSAQKYLSSREAAIYLRISLRTLERWNKSGVVNPIKVSSSKYAFRRESLDALMDERESAA
jgi:excisionase family DNA binding protein